LVVVLGLFTWYQLTLNDAVSKRDSSLTRKVSTTSNGEVIKSGTFVFLDRSHFGSGVVEIKDTGDNVLVEFGDDFNSSQGPDLFVWLVKEQDLGGAVRGVDTDEGMFLELGPLESFSGKQSYQITQEEFDEYNYAVVIWCKAFGIQFTNAVLN
jgi:hypothetical protein